MTDPICSFEGPEKKLEVILFAPQKSLRSNRDGRWQRVVAASGAEIVSYIGNDRVDAYLLAESSLFVWDDRILMITCGRTTLVKAVPAIVETVGRQNVALVFYERKNPVFPDGQQTDFKTDAAELASYFPGEHHRLGPKDGDHVHVFYSSHAKVTPGKDATFQILMNDLDPVVMKIFSAESAGSAVQASVLSRLCNLYSGMTVDSYFFRPCGYSLNGIRQGGYYTVHVTPQPDGSYASFETNVIGSSYETIIRQMTSVFRPGRFSIVLTASMDDSCRTLHRTADMGLPGYTITEKIGYQLDCGYAVTFLNHIGIDR